MELFAGVAVSDFPRAVDWFERLLGQPASFVAHETEHVWTLAEQRHVYVLLSPERAGHSMVTFFIDDLDAFVAAATVRGIEPAARETYENGVCKTTYRDPDGNEVGVGGGPDDEGAA